MRILFITSSMGYGGAERVISSLSNVLCAKGHEISIYLTSGSDKCVYKLDERVSVFPAKSIKNIFTVLRGIRTYTKRFDPDIVVPFMSYQCIYAIVALAFSKYPVVVCERNDPKYMDGKESNKFRILVRDFVFRFADGAVFQTNEAKEYFPPSIQKKSTVIMNPINSSALIDLYDQERQKRIVNIGRLTEQKNQSLLLDAFSMVKDEFPDYILEIYGDGKLKDQLKAKSLSLGIEDSVRFCENVNNIHERIKSAQVFAFTSDYEGLPNALAEAMALGLACVSTDCSPGGARALIDDGINGLIVPCGDAEAFAGALRKLLSDAELVCSFSKKAVQIRSRLDFDKITSEWENYFYQIIHG